MSVTYMSNLLRVGIIGLGSISSVHIPAVMDMENAKITAICDIDPERLQAAQKRIGDVFISKNGERPDGFCNNAWECIKKYATALANGEGNFFDGWMKNPHSAMISCNDGFRPVSFLLETV